jgi:hypothetical protein
MSAICPPKIVSLSPLAWIPLVGALGVASAHQSSEIRITYLKLLGSPLGA